MACSAVALRVLEACLFDYNRPTWAKIHIPPIIKKSKRAESRFLEHIPPIILTLKWAESMEFIQFHAVFVIITGSLQLIRPNHKLKTMLKRSTPIIATILLVVAFFACKTTDKALGTAQDSLLWKIEGKGLNKPSYVLGTIHMLPQKDYFFNDAMKNAFEQSEQVVMELDMDDPQMSMQLLKFATMSDGSTLDKLLSPADYQKLDDLCKKSVGVGIAAFNKWQPMLVYSLILKEFLGEQPASYELSLVQMAQGANKEIKGLESVEDQTKAMSSISYAKQATYLGEHLKDMESQKALFLKMVALYKAQDLSGLLKYIEQESGGVDFSSTLLNERNANWIAPMIASAKAKPTFFAVGAGHLAGEKGVLKLLQKEGYRLTALR
jgi:uncharacterized protein